MNESEYTKPEYRKLRRYDGALACYRGGSPCQKDVYFKCDTKYGRCLLYDKPKDPSGERVYSSQDACSANCMRSHSKEDKTDAYF